MHSPQAAVGPRATSGSAGKRQGPCNIPAFVGPLVRSRKTKPCPTYFEVSFLDSKSQVTATNTTQLEAPCMGVMYRPQVVTYCRVISCNLQRAVLLINTAVTYWHSVILSRTIHFCTINTTVVLLYH